MKKKEQKRINQSRKGFLHISLLRSQIISEKGHKIANPYRLFLPQNRQLKLIL